MIDASALLLPVVGLLPGDDPRVLSTIDAVQRRLRDARGFVHRYEDGTDGFEGTEGAFVMCTFWLAHALALAGKREEAVDVFRTAASASNDLGLMAEEIDPRTGEMLGNFPQAFSHVGLVTARPTLSPSFPTRTSTTYGRPLNADTGRRPRGAPKNGPDTEGCRGWLSS